jgi:hypothetical protein
LAAMVLIVLALTGRDRASASSARGATAPPIYSVGSTMQSNSVTSPNLTMPPISVRPPNLTMPPNSVGPPNSAHR